MGGHVAKLSCSDNSSYQQRWQAICMVERIRNMDRDEHVRKALPSRSCKERSELCEPTQAPRSRRTRECSNSRSEPPEAETPFVASAVRLYLRARFAAGRCIRVAARPRDPRSRRGRFSAPRRTRRRKFTADSSSDDDFGIESEDDHELEYQPGNEIETSWAQCDVCDKWRVTSGRCDVQEDEDGFVCEMVGGGVTCATPEDQDEDAADDSSAEHTDNASGAPTGSHVPDLMLRENWVDGLGISMKSDSCTPSCGAEIDAQHDGSCSGLEDNGSEMSFVKDSPVIGDCMSGDDSSTTKSPLTPTLCAEQRADGVRETFASDVDFTEFFDIFRYQLHNQQCASALVPPV